MAQLTKTIGRVVLPSVALLALSFSPMLAATQASKREARKQARAGEDPAAIYKRQCASCHGADGAGKTAMGKTFKLKDLRSEEVRKMTDAQLFDIIAKGKGKMPAYENNLGQDRVHALVKYIRGMASKK